MSNLLLCSRTCHGSRLQQDQSHHVQFGIQGLARLPHLGASLQAPSTAAMVVTCHSPTCLAVFLSLCLSSRCPSSSRPSFHYLHWSNSFKLVQLSLSCYLIYEADPGSFSQHQLPLPPAPTQFLGLVELVVCQSPQYTSLTDQQVAPLRPPPHQCDFQSLWVRDLDSPASREP